MWSNKKIVVRFLTVFFSLVFLTVVYLITNQTTMAEKTIYSGNENHVVSLAFASKLTDNYQKTSGPGDIVAGYFGRNIYDKILSQKNCIGIRVYNARNEDGSPTFVLVGVDGNGKDIVSGVVGEDIYPCPPFCWPQSALDNSAKTKGLALNK